MKEWIAIVLAVACLLSLACCADPSATTGSTPASTSAQPSTTNARPTTTPPTTVPPTTVPTMTSSPPTTPLTYPTCPPVEGDPYWGDYRGKHFSTEEYMSMSIGYRLDLYSNGTFQYYGAPTSSTIDQGTWALEGDILYLTGLAWDGSETGCSSCFRYVPGETAYDGKLVFIKGDHDLTNLKKEADGLEFLFKGVSPWN